MEALWQDIWKGVQADFSDLPDAEAVTQLMLRMLLAILLGGILGYQRERQGKEAGVRTHMLVALGSAFFVLIPLQSGMPLADMSRVLQGLITGIGFLGAGAILKQQDTQQIHGLTTAAGLWLTASMGIAVGLGRETSAILATLLAFIIFALLPYFRPRADASEAPLQEEAASSAEHL